RNRSDARSRPSCGTAAPSLPPPKCSTGWRLGPAGRRPPARNSSRDRRTPGEGTSEKACARFPPSRFDDDLAGHLFVAAAAEDVAVEFEGAGLHRHDPHARDLAGLDVLVDLEIGDLEAVLAIE